MASWPVSGAVRLKSLDILFIHNWIESQGGTLVKNTPGNAGDAKDLGSIPGLGRFPGKGNDNLLQYSCLENSMARGAWQATFHRVTMSRT